MSGLSTKIGAVVLVLGSLLAASGCGSDSPSAGDRSDKEVKSSGDAVTYCAMLEEEAKRVVSALDKDPDYQVSRDENVQFWTKSIELAPADLKPELKIFVAYLSGEKIDNDPAMTERTANSNKILDWQKNNCKKS